MRPFLTARWVNLILAQYAVSDELIAPHLPPGTEPDRWNGSAHVSLVPFQFLDTRVFGCRWPGFTNFPELNLRTYVRHGDRRGVVFIREYIPSRLIAWVARRTYNEPYRTARLVADCYVKGDRLTANYALTLAGQTHRIWAVGDAQSAVPPVDSCEQCFKEQQWGFGRTRDGRLISFEVQHPPWTCHRVRDYGIELDWSQLYGDRWNVMNGREPDSVFLIAGSAVSVFPHSR